MTTTDVGCGGTSVDKDDTLLQFPGEETMQLVYVHNILAREHMIIMMTYLD